MESQSLGRVLATVGAGLLVGVVVTVPLNRWPRRRS
jgi:hypothetical protein